MWDLFKKNLYNVGYVLNDTRNLLSNLIIWQSIIKKDMYNSHNNNISIISSVFYSIKLWICHDCEHALL